MFRAFEYIIFYVVYNKLVNYNSRYIFYMIFILKNTEELNVWYEYSCLSKEGILK